MAEQDERLTLCSAAPTIARAVSSALPEIVDPWRMVQARRTFQGRFPLSTLKRLATALASTEGEVAYELDFDRDEFGISGVRVRATTALPLTCQRSLEVFALPVSVDARLGFMVNEEVKAWLPQEYEPLLLDPAGLRLADVIEDELILALPLVPVKPGTIEIEREWRQDGGGDVEPKPNPFAVLKTTFDK